MTAAAESADSAVYVFGVVAADDAAALQTAEGADASDGSDGIAIVPAGSVAAVVGAVSAHRPLGLASDMRRHDRVVSSLLDRGVTVLPMRFGAVVGEAEVLARDVLQPNEAVLEAALRELAGRVQFTVRVDYVREAVLAAVVRGDSRVAAARQAAGDHAGQVRLGELVVAAIDRRRGGDAERIERELAPLAQGLHCDLSSDPDRVADFACLVARDDAAEFARAAEAIAERYADAVKIRVLGPLAPYNFVPEL